MFSIGRTADRSAWRCGVSEEGITMPRVGCRCATIKDANLPQRQLLWDTKRQDNRKRGRRGYDGAKKSKGRKRVKLCDMSGNLLKCVVVPADTADLEPELTSHLRRQ